MLMPLEGEVADDGTVIGQAPATTPNGQLVGPFDVEGEFSDEGFRLFWAGSFQGGPNGQISFECEAGGA